MISIKFEFNEVYCKPITSMKILSNSTYYNFQVKADDGLPQKLCGECYSTMNSAYQFRKQCIKMDTELKSQLSDLLRQCNDSNIDNLENAAEMVDDENSDIAFANDPMKQLEAVIKKEPMDSDDDYYYVLVIDNPKDKENDEQMPRAKITEITEEVEHNIKLENEENIEENTGNTLQISDIYTDSEEILPDIKQSKGVSEHESKLHNFKKSMGSFLMSNNIPSKVPATILENEEEGQQDTEDGMNIDETQDSTSQDTNFDTDNNLQYNEEEITDQSLIKILTTTGEDGTLLLKSNAMVQYLTDGGQLVMNNEDGEQSQEVILCEGDESQFHIVKYDGSELVIEYADEGIATVLQQADDSYLCECGEQFQDLEEFEKHQHKHNPAGEHLCNLCGKGFESAEILTGHMLLHNVPGLLLQCPFCDQVMKRSTLTQHIKYGHNNIKPQCEVCNKTFANPNNLKRHMMIHTGVKEFACDICYKRFHQKITMQTHRLTHMNPLNCSQCDLVFKDKETFDQHKVNGVCPKNKAKEELMKTVKQEITTSLGKLLGYACSLCKKMFSLESALERHIETSHIVDPTELLCSECGEVLSSKGEMQMHILSHDKRKSIKRFECTSCGKGCSSQAMLLMHERVHTNERPFSCQLCPLRFKTKTHLRTHQLTHTREKKFGCSVCMKFFALKGNLVVHLRTHTGERPYVCPLCDEAFIDSKYLKKHKVKKHSISNLPWNQFLSIDDEEKDDN